MRTYLQFKVVEINLSTGIRIGHIIAQQPFATGVAAATVKSNVGYVDNGGFFKLNEDGEVVLPADGIGPVYLQYTEELLTDRALLADYGLPMTDYPRLIALYTGDVFTTNNYTGTAATDAVAYVNAATGQLTIVADIATVELALGVGVETPIFHVTLSTLPDGTTEAAEFLYISDYVGTTV
jgi:hypothetical protein